MAPRFKCSAVILSVITPSPLGRHAGVGRGVQQELGQGSDQLLLLGGGQLDPELGPGGGWEQRDLSRDRRTLSAPDDTRADADVRSPRRWPWARLLRRVFALQVLECDRCGGPRQILGAVTEPHAVPRGLVSSAAMSASVGGGGRWKTGRAVGVGRA
ncbi:MAG: hypothetical protein ACRELA_17015 [Candidatus Rokuibacteriota bacterium]